MNPRIEIVPEKKFVGKRLTMSFSDNKTPELWRRFMPRRREIVGIPGRKLYSIEVYPADFFDEFDPENKFEKWAAVEVTNFDKVSLEMEKLVSPEGLYAVFVHGGTAADGVKTYQNIFINWLPNSEFAADLRPHFAVMGEKYKNDDPNSEEEIYIPIKPKTNAD